MEAIVVERSAHVRIARVVWGPPVGHLLQGYVPIRTSLPGLKIGNQVSNVSSQERHVRRQGWLKQSFVVGAQLRLLDCKIGHHADPGILVVQ